MVSCAFIKNLFMRSVDKNSRQIIDDIKVSEKTHKSDISRKLPNRISMISKTGSVPRTEEYYDVVECSPEQLHIIPKCKILIIRGDQQYKHKIVLPENLLYLDVEYCEIDLENQKSLIGISLKTCKLVSLLPGSLKFLYINYWQSSAITLKNLKNLEVVVYNNFCVPKMVTKINLPSLKSIIFKNYSKDNASYSTFPRWILRDVKDKKIILKIIDVHISGETYEEAVAKHTKDKYYKDPITECKKLTKQLNVSKSPMGKLFRIINSREYVSTAEVQKIANALGVKGKNVAQDLISASNKYSLIFSEYMNASYITVDPVSKQFV